MNGEERRLIGFAGYSGSGKTTLASQTVAILKRRGCKVAAVKHDGHGHYREAEGTDSARYREAGADAVVVVSPGGIVKYEAASTEPGLAEALQELNGYDLIVAEGFKRERHPKIVVFRDEAQSEALAAVEPPIVAYAVKSDADVYVPEGIVRLDMDNPEETADFILKYLGKCL